VIVVPMMWFRHRMTRCGAAALIGLGIVITSVAVRADFYPIAVLRALDKVTARVTTLYVPIGEPARFGTLEITADVCDKRPPEEPPESAAFLRIVEARRDQPPVDVFHGWMFASSPGLSPLEHAVYDIWVLDCVSNAPQAETSSSGSGSP
jgi:hypothetical protein